MDTTAERMPLEGGLNVMLNGVLPPAGMESSAGWVTENSAELLLTGLAESTKAAVPVLVMVNVSVFEPPATLTLPKSVPLAVRGDDSLSGMGTAFYERAR